MLDSIDFQYSIKNIVLKRLNKYKQLTLKVKNYKGNADELFVEENGKLYEVDVLGKNRQNFKPRVELKTGTVWLEPIEEFVEIERTRQQKFCVGSLRIEGIYNTGILERHVIEWELVFENGILKNLITLKGPKKFFNVSNNFRKYSKIKKVLQQGLRFFKKQKIK